MTPAEFHVSRLRLNRTQYELARMLGVTPTSVTRYETGRRTISDTVAILLRLLVERYGVENVQVQPRQRLRLKANQPSSNAA